MEDANLSPLGKVKPTQGNPGGDGPSRVLKSFAKHTDAAILIVRQLAWTEGLLCDSVSSGKKARVSYQKLGVLTKIKRV